MAIELNILGFSSTDVSDLRGWKPNERAEVFFPLCIEVGERGKSGGNLFQVVVATPEGIRSFGEKYGQLPDRNVLVCLDYEWVQIEARVSRIVASCARDSWQESMSSLQRFFQWEYEE